MRFLALKEPSSVMQVILITLGLVTGLIVLVVGLIMTSRYAPWRRQQPLLLKLQNFSVTNLNTSNSLSDASFETRLLFANQNAALEILVPSFESLLYYNHSDGDAGKNDKKKRGDGLPPVACTVVEAVHLGPKRQRAVDVKYGGSQCGGEQPYVEESVLDEMRRDVKRGFLRLSVGLSLRVKYRTGILYWEYELKPMCPCFRLKFAAEYGVGWLQTPQPIKCPLKFPN